MKIEDIFLEAFELFKSSLDEDSTDKSISFTEVHSSNSKHSHYFVISTVNISLQNFEHVVGYKYESKEVAIKEGIIILISQAKQNCEKQIETPTDEQCWMKHPVTYWYARMKDINYFIERNKIKI